MTHQLAFWRIGVAQTRAAVELLGIGDIDIVGGRPAFMGNQVILGGIHGDPVQPCRELSIAAEASYRAVSANETVLGHVLTFAPVGDVAPDQADDPVLVLAHQHIERRAFAALHTPDQFRVQLLGCFDIGHNGPHSCQPNLRRTV